MFYLLLQEIFIFDLDQNILFLQLDGESVHIVALTTSKVIICLIFFPYSFAYLKNKFQWAGLSFP